MSLLLATAHLRGPHIDFGALSPLIALLGGAVVVLCFGMLGSGFARRTLVPLLSLVALGTALGLTIWQWNTHEGVAAGALRVDRLGLVLSIILIAGGACAVLLAWRSLAAKEAAHGEFHALLLDLAGGDVAARDRPEHGGPVRRPGAALDPAVRAVRHRNAPRALARVRAQVPDHRLGRVGHAAVRAGDDLRRHRPHRLRRDRGRAVEGRPGHRPADADRGRAVRRGPRLQGLGGAVPPVDPGRLRGRPHAGDRVHGGHDQGGGTGRLHPPVRGRPDRHPQQLGAGAGGARDDHDPGRQRRGARAVLAEADARLLLGRARSATCSPAWSWRAAWA